ncbi:MAG TPA: NAD(P)H-hydrate dehydratase [Candidatus Krumholzibacteria bacterium]|nr:NAD(P)H-hydrate dehydratase [Candidatus Krumholzibacteria bacterium]HRX50864.1 NAD(P)H-hydrate dehydratase [Candidatus Krumholzibacteria bacterium]
MKAATSAQMAAIDRETIAGGVPGLELMERAGRAMLLALVADDRLGPCDRVAICCGKGNNGGDGLVLARLLHGWGRPVAVMLPPPGTELSPDAQANLERLPAEVRVERPAAADRAAVWRELQGWADVAVDALFGTGIRPPLRGDDAALIAAFDPLEAEIVSLDIPSGVCGDDGRVDPVAVSAHRTLTVGLPKLGLLLPPGRDHAGEVEVLDIGFPEDVVARHAGGVEVLTPEEAAALRAPRPSDTHKYAAGTALVMAGSQRYGGAALLAGLGALRSGAGLTTLALPDVHAAAALAFLPEALLAPLAVGAGGGLAPLADAALDALLDGRKAWAVGPGLGDDPATDVWVIRALARVETPVVVDADALSAFARAGAAPRCAAAEAVLTPHGGELARLAGVTSAELAARRLELVPELARRWGVVLVAKGSPTLVAAPDGGLTLIPVGHDALAVGGTGDVLTGLLCGLLAQGLPAHDAARLGCWLHGRAGELAAEALGGRRGVLAREVADLIPAAQGGLDPAAPEERS